MKKPDIKNLIHDEEGTKKIRDLVKKNQKFKITLIVNNEPKTKEQKPINKKQKSPKAA